MLETYWVEPAPVERARACWLAPEIGHYVDRPHARGYSAKSIRQRVPLLCDFAEFAAERGATAAGTAIEQIDGVVTSRLQGRKARSPSSAAAASYEHTIRRVVSETLRLATTGRIETQREAQPFPLQAEAPGFPAYLDEERGLQPTTVAHYGYAPGRFAGYLTITADLLAEADRRFHDFARPYGVS